MTLQGHLAHTAHPGQRPDGEMPGLALRALLDWERSVGANPDIEDEFSVQARKVLDFEPLAVRELMPLAWRVDRPRLDVHTEFVRGVLQVTILPRRYTGARIRTGRWAFDDLSTFDSASDRGRRPVTVLELNTGHSVNSEEGAAGQRGVVFALYEFTIKRLAMHFDCRIEAGLVCFGAGNELDVRIAPRKDDVELANLLEYDRTELWHPDLDELCRADGVSARDALAFYRAKLKALPRSEWAITWQGYCGLKVDKYRSRYSEPALPTVLKVLEIVDDPVAHPPLRAGSEEARRALKTIAEAVGLAGVVPRICADYQMNTPAAWTLVAAVDPQMYESLPRTAQHLMDELTTLSAKGESDSPFGRDLRKKLLSWVEGSWGDALGTKWDVKLRRAVRDLHIDVPGLLAWSRERAPEFHEWLQSAESRFKLRAKRASRS